MSYDDEEEDEEAGDGSGFGGVRTNGAAVVVEPDKIKPNVDESKGEIRCVLCTVAEENSIVANIYVRRRLLIFLVPTSPSLSQVFFVQLPTVLSLRQ